jgi:hypothetical protein
VAASLVLGALLFARNRPAELARRVRFLERTASAEPARRRLAGSSTAFDRNYFAFLEGARRSLPQDAAGVALFLPAPSEPALYLAAYTMAPLPVAPAGAPRPGWVGFAYGSPRPAGWMLLREVPGGALLVPAPGAAR